MTDRDASGFAVVRQMITGNKPKPKPAQADPRAANRSKALDVLRREYRLMSEIQRSRLPELTGIDLMTLSAFEQAGALTDDQMRTLTPYLIATTALDAGWQFVNGPSVSWNKAPKPEPRKPDARIDALADLLNEPNHDAEIVWNEDDVWTAEMLNAASARVARDGERIQFEPAADGFVRVRQDTGKLLMLYHIRVSATPGYVQLVDSLNYELSYTGNAAALIDSAVNDLSGNTALAKGIAGRWLAGKNGAEIAKMRAFNEAMKRGYGPGRRYSVTPEDVRAAIAFVGKAIRGEAEITLPTRDAALIVYARCRLLNQA